VDAACQWRNLNHYELIINLTKYYCDQFRTDGVVGTQIWKKINAHKILVGNYIGEHCSVAKAIRTIILKLILKESVERAVLIRLAQGILDHTDF
jgi:predicted RNA-binding protein YlqC (UPF0109 family)